MLKRLRSLLGADGGLDDHQHPDPDRHPPSAHMLPRVCPHFSMNVWQTLPPPHSGAAVGPGPRSGHVAVCDGEHMYVYGGFAAVADKGAAPDACLCDGE